MVRRPTRLFRQLCAALLVFGVVGTAEAQAYPSRRITFIVGFPPGGGADAVARVVGEHVSKALGQPVVVENRAGATSNIAASVVAGSVPDGYTVLSTTTAIAINASLYRKLSYSLAEDLIAVAAPVSAPETYSVHPSYPRTLKEYLALAKSTRTAFASAGVGSGSHLSMYYFLKELAKVEVDYVPFQGGGPTIQAVIGNHVGAAALTAVSTTVAQIRSGKMVCLGVAALQRYAELPDCPTFAESGFPYEASTWVGFFMPARTPAAVVARLNEAINSAIDDPATGPRLATNGVMARRTASETAAFVASEVAVWAARVKAAGVQVE